MTTMLVVDDNEGTRLVFSDWLRRAGYTVHEAADGEQALELLSRTPFDLVVLDVNLPDMSGLDICAHIKATRSTAAIPVLQVSATAVESSDRSAALNMGADGFLVEPVARDELVATAGALLRYYEARRTAERIAARLERLHQATLLLNAASTIADLLGFAATGLVSIFGAAAAVLVTKDGVGRLAWAAPNGIEPSMVRCDQAAVERLARMASSREHIGTDDLPLPVRQLVTGGNLVSPIATPRGELIGALILLVERDHSEDELMLDHLSQALAVALENQRLYAIEHEIALTLQRAILPAAVSEIPELEIAVRYQAASDTAEIGGDFYEVLRLDEHRTMLAAGDVVGHSLQAATVMAELRYSLRAFAGVDVPADEILCRLNDTLIDSGKELTATVCLVTVDTAAMTIEVHNAGHPSPILSDDTGTRFLDEHGPLLGLRNRPNREPMRAPLRPNAVLVLATDGLLERRDEDIQLGMERMRQAVAGHDGDAHSLVELLLDEVVTDDSMIADDIAVVAARHRPGGVPRQTS